MKLRFIRRHQPVLGLIQCISWMHPFQRARRPDGIECQEARKKPPDYHSALKGQICSPYYGRPMSGSDRLATRRPETAKLITAGTKSFDHPSSLRANSRH